MPLQRKISNDFPLRIVALDLQYPSRKCRRERIGYQLRGPILDSTHLLGSWRIETHAIDLNGVTASEPRAETGGKSRRHAKQTIILGICGFAVRRSYRMQRRDRTELLFQRLIDLSQYCVQILFPVFHS